MKVSLHYCWYKVYELKYMYWSCHNNYTAMPTGLLEAVHDLNVTSINSSIVLISWSPPFTLEGVPILGYNVTTCKTNINEDVLICETISVKASTNMVFHFIKHPSNISFIVTVVPFNEGGTGNPTHYPLVSHSSISSKINNSTV